MISAQDVRFDPNDLLDDFPIVYASEPYTEELRADLEELPSYLLVEFEGEDTGVNANPALEFAQQEAITSVMKRTDKDKLRRRCRS